MNRTLSLAALLALVFLLAQIRPAAGYALESHHWPVGTSANPTIITMNLQLSSATYPYPLQYDGGYFPTQGLQDFSGSWNDVAIDALADWNQYFVGAQFESNETDSFTPANGDGVNSVLFDSSAFGQSFGADAIAVTLRYYNTGTNYTVEGDVVVNTAYEWDSYRGSLQSDGYGYYIYDLRRVLDHEFGHVLGLDHPDLATPPQDVTAIMNSTISDLDHIELDDIAGVMAIYGRKTILEPITVTASPPEGGTVTGNGSFALGSTQTITAAAAPGYAFVQWEDGSTNPTRTVTVPLEDGNYTATFANALDAWTISSSANSGVVNNFREILFADGMFRAFGGGMATSPDGVTWTGQVPSTPQTYNANVVAYHAGVYVSGGDSGEIWSSTDGVNWTDRSPGVTGNFEAVAWGNGLFVAVGSPEGTGDPALIATSPDGVHWTQRTQGVSFASLTGIVYGNGTFVAVGTSQSGAASITSSDGVNWTTTTPISGVYSFSNVVYGNGGFLAGVNYGFTATSLDGVNWTVKGSSYYTSNEVGYGNGLYFSWADNVFATSTDAVSWPYRTLADNSEHFSFAYGNGRYVGTGDIGIMYSGLVSPVLQPVLPVINSGALTGFGTANFSYNYQIGATNSPLEFNAVGLPAGLTIDLQTGAISGTPTVSGTFPVTLFATNDAGSGTATLMLNIAAPAVPCSARRASDLCGMGDGQRRFGPHHGYAQGGQCAQLDEVPLRHQPRGNDEQHGSQRIAGAGYGIGRQLADADVSAERRLADGGDGRGRVVHRHAELEHAGRCADCGDRAVRQRDGRPHDAGAGAGHQRGAVYPAERD